MYEKHVENCLGLVLQKSGSGTSTGASNSTTEESIGEIEADGRIKCVTCARGFHPVSFLLPSIHL